MPKLQKMLMLTDKGYKDLKKAVAACTLTNLSLMLPFGITLQIIIELIKPLNGGEFSPNTLWILFGAGFVSAFIVFLCYKNDYKKTYVVSYMESENARVAIARLESDYQYQQSVFSKNNERIAAFLKFRKSKALTREMLTELVEKIIVHSPDSIEIIWRFDDEYRAVCALAKGGEQ